MTSILQRGLYVSCQAPAGPLRDSGMLAAIAQAAELGGAAGVRAEGLDDIRRIRGAVSVPVIGLVKRGTLDVYITPSIQDALDVAHAGADLVAVDATLRDRPDGTDSSDFLREVVARLDVPVLADVDSVEAAVAAERAGVGFVATTLAGYTADGPPDRGPDLKLVAAIVAAVSIPVIAEGRFQYPEEAAQAIERGAYGVVVGGAITDPISITRRFVLAIGEAR